MAARLAPKLLLAAGALVALAAIDLGIRGLGMLPPPSPLLFYAASHMAGFSPFVDDEAEILRIKPDWVSSGEYYRRDTGTRTGRVFVYPGFRDVVFRRTRPPGGVRVFVLGGSTAFGQFLPPGETFAHGLRTRLQEALGDRSVEVLNLGCPGLESTRVRILLERVLELDPSLVVVCSGHNEFLMGENLTSPAVGAANRARAALVRLSSLAAWLDWALAGDHRQRSILSEEQAALEAGRVLTYTELDPAVAGTLPSTAYREQVVRDYAANIRAMAAAARTRRVPILFVLPVANLLLPPERSGHPAGFSRQAEFDTALARAEHAYQAADMTGTVAAAEAALALSPRFARAHYLRGLALLALGRDAEARQAFQAAVDCNLRAHRITSPLETAMITAAEAEGAPWVDLRPLFHHDLSFAAAERLFIDHCHPTAEGHALIAAAIAPPTRTLLTGTAR